MKIDIVFAVPNDRYRDLAGSCAERIKNIVHIGFAYAAGILKSDYFDS